MRDEPQKCNAVAVKCNGEVIIFSIHVAFEFASQTVNPYLDGSTKAALSNDNEPANCRGSETAVILRIVHREM